MKRRKKSNPFSSLHHAAILFFIPLLINGCTIKGPIPIPVPDQSEKKHTSTPASPASVYSPTLGPAVSLYHDAENFLIAGNTQGAELSMERALRIEPQNGHYWYTMARIKYTQLEYSQAIQFCLKSKSLAGRDQHLLALNDNLIDKASNHLTKHPPN